MPPSCVNAKGENSIKANWINGEIVIILNFRTHYHDSKLLPPSQICHLYLALLYYNTKVVVTSHYIITDTVFGNSS